MEKEIWKDIPNYEGIYQASNLGRIRTCEGKTTYTEKHGVRHWKQRILKPRWSKSGYRISMWKDGKCKDIFVHRLVGMTFLGVENSNLTINHIDGNRENNNVKNLEWCSLGENITKGFETGLYHNQTKVAIIDKRTNVKYIFRSMALASRFMNRNNGYIFHCIKHDKFEDNEYSWRKI